MNAPRIIPETVLRLQITASDPAVSAWVAANAGSGKTHVLAQRVIRLLLEGVDPGKILCITFTKAAAANMANRVFDELRRWTALDDREARCGDPTDVQPRSRSGAAGARAAAVRVGAGDAGWAQGSDHPRILHTASASVSIRGRRRRPVRRARRGVGSAASGRDQPRRIARCYPRPGCPARPCARNRHCGRRRPDLQGGRRRSHPKTRRGARVDRPRRQRRRGRRPAVQDARNQRR